MSTGSVAIALTLLSCAGGLDVEPSAECTSHDLACQAILADDAKEDLSLLQHSVAVHEAEVDANTSMADDAQLHSSHLEPLERLLRVLTQVKHRLSSSLSRWGWGGGDSKPTPESLCTSGLFVKYSDIKLEEDLEASFTMNAPSAAQCSSNSGFGPNECCIQFEVPLDVSVHALLARELTEDAVLHASISGWYGWLPILDSLSCKVCGEPCMACPTISRYLPSLFPCEPRPTPDCPILAGNVTTNASVTLPEDIRQKLSGSKATVKYSLTRADGSSVSSGEIYAKAS
mmetsp:Transcript_40980/g.95253  ORF Transcript_40980/g.95253 Transcript_40980/m.95253 type:complete len:287 (-) Transcript_40980:80-940(-)